MPRPPDCPICHMRTVAPGAKRCKVCLDNLAKQAKRAAKEQLKITTVDELKAYNARAEPEKRELDMLASYVAPAGEPRYKAADAVRRWRAAPWLFVREVFHVVPDAWQDDALHALTESGASRFCSKACKGPGKTAFEAWVIWWFMTCFLHPKVVVTSITEANLHDNLWAELAKWRNKSPMLSAMFEYRANAIYSKDHPDTWFVSPRTWSKDADGARQAQTLAGLHAENTLVVVDEAGGVPTGVLVAGLAHHATQDPTGRVKETHFTVICGNPDDLDSALGWACTEDAAHWHVTEITGDPDDPKRSPRIDKDEARKLIATFGRENPWVLVNIFGRFPPIGSNKLLGSDQIRRAMAWVPPLDTYRKYPRVMTLDVARSTNRDRSVLCRRQGSVIFPFLVYRLADSEVLAGQVAFEFARWPAEMIIVDVVGVGGPVFDHLKALGLPVIQFLGGSPARDPVRFADRRTETWWHAAQEVKGPEGGEPELALPASCQELIAEGSAPLLHFTRKGQMKLESKDDMLKRGVSSPDIFDSLAMSFAEPASITTRVSESTRKALQRPTLVEYDPFADEQRMSAQSPYDEE